MTKPIDILIERLKTPKCTYCKGVIGNNWGCNLKGGLVTNEPCEPTDRELCPLAIVHESVTEGGD